jgi:hypothetical protein
LSSEGRRKRKKNLRRKKKGEKRNESQKAQKIRPLPLRVAKIIKKKRQGIHVESSSTTILLLHPDDSLGDITDCAG